MFFLNYTWVVGYCQKRTQGSVNTAIVPSNCEVYKLAAHIVVPTIRRVWAREYWIVYRGPGFLALIWFGSSPAPSHPLPSVSSCCDTQEDGERETTFWQGGGGAKSNDSEKDWSSINHSILAGLSCRFNGLQAVPKILFPPNLRVRAVEVPVSSLILKYCSHQS